MRRNFLSLEESPVRRNFWTASLYSAILLAMSEPRTATSVKPSGLGMTSTRSNLSLGFATYRPLFVFRSDDPARDRTKRGSRPNSRDALVSDKPSDRILAITWTVRFHVSCAVSGSAKYCFEVRGTDILFFAPVDDGFLAGSFVLVETVVRTLVACFVGVVECAGRLAVFGSSDFFAFAGDVPEARLVFLVESDCFLNCFFICEYCLCDFAYTSPYSRGEFTPKRVSSSSGEFSPKLIGGSFGECKLRCGRNSKQFSAKLQISFVFLVEKIHMKRPSLHYARSFAI